ncbi:MAG: aminotransferase class I/II-fold pyridoxal phosphate-dependent enzyme [Clostridiales bacterium]|nr:aminotransferase class I/II-fold pyridoxal phosphate-dependent enzyme [Clostridiales bacterium]
MENNFTRESMLLGLGKGVSAGAQIPETPPIHLTTAFTMRDLSEVEQVYRQKEFTYVRTRNPNRTALQQALSFLENGEETLVCSSGMGAISSTLISLLSPGDHVLANRHLYGETYDLLVKLLARFGVQHDLVDFEDLDLVRASMRSNTKMLYTEVLSNPLLSVADIGGLAELAHAGDALLVVDNTFTTPLAIRPLDFGADLSINSLTKFLNGHSDAMAGAVTGSAALCERIRPIAMLLGVPGDPFDAWLILRGLQTVELRVGRQMDNALALARSLEQNPAVRRVHYPGLERNRCHQVAEKLFTDRGFGAMLSFELESDTDKINRFMCALHFAHYAPTLGGVASSLSHPVTSSHSNVPEAERLAMGITQGTFRLSVGIENPQDLIADFAQALEVFTA